MYMGRGLRFVSKFYTGVIRSNLGFIRKKTLKRTSEYVQVVLTLALLCHLPDISTIFNPINIARDEMSVLLLPSATKLRQGNIFIGVCQSFCSGGYLPQCMVGYTPPGQVHPRAGTPPPPPAPGKHTPPPPTVTAGDGTHPTGMLSCSIFQSSRTLLINKVRYNQQSLPIVSGAFHQYHQNRMLALFKTYTSSLYLPFFL